MYMKGQTRVSMVPEKNTSGLEGAGMLSFGSKVTEKGLRLMNGDEYLDQSALTLQPWFCWSQRYFRCRLPPFAAITPLPAARNHISLLAYTCCLCRAYRLVAGMSPSARSSVYVWPYGRASRDCEGFCPFVSRCMCVRACDNHVPCVLVSC